jgi:probable phosphomutase (TIGR03848 family)
VVGAKEGAACSAHAGRGEADLEAMREAREPPAAFRPGPEPAQLAVGEGPKCEDDAHVFKQGKLAGKEGRARFALLWEGTVVRRGAAHRRGDEGALQAQAVSASLAYGLVGEAGASERREEEVAGAVAGEHPSRAVTTMSSWGETDDEKPCGGIAETGYGASPVGIASMCRSGTARDGFAPGNEPGARVAGDDVGLERLELEIATAGDAHKAPGYVGFVPGSSRRRRPTVVLFVRHGTTPTTGQVLPGRARGLHLAPEGLREAGQVGERLARLGAVEAVYASPLERTMETAKAIAARLYLPVCSDRSLIECDFGSWTGAPLAQLRRRPEWAMVQRHPSGFRFPGGESFADVRSRMGQAVERLIAAHPGGTVVAVSHADPIKVVLGDALGQPLDLVQRIVISPCSLSAVAYGPGGPVVLAINSTSELGWLSGFVRATRAHANGSVSGQARSALSRVGP